MYFLNSEMVFPSVTEASEDGLLAVGGDVSAERLLLAYRSGIFPWYDVDSPILWWSPDPRMVLFPHKLKVSKSLQKTINSKQFSITFNKEFTEVITNCSKVQRKGQQGTWITHEMIAAYSQLHSLGHAISVEVWQESKLVGGLYGVDLADKRIFCGESMFSHVSDASKVAFYYLVALLQSKEYRLIDCQVYTGHLERFGAEEIPRELFLSYLNC
ncbi:leucyl/phenylalanyl-tRNA--protein transferase [Ulvibacter sp. MAR_2010_11]|uniref:leucyl/phenylalanyl-tRNA--protein transferase n=1 Tax=Ulvibacter sp. MAR_2010_11 TaxID=1250229 RepID=UPI000C2C9298|nr:leucyl/phenylalanyl-tRNA--protein transferase [Ulvibacter sp. MAR_2010_11]PKA82682.1 leucyl/phenylalanyl-tRNA--protein transferase [Ulvibacter sp. MAR_2010_11]